MRFWILSFFVSPNIFSWSLQKKVGQFQFFWNLCTDLQYFKKDAKFVRNRSLILLCFASKRIFGILNRRTLHNFKFKYVFQKESVGIPVAAQLFIVFTFSMRTFFFEESLRNGNHQIMRLLIIYRALRLAQLLTWPDTKKMENLSCFVQFFLHNFILFSYLFI